MTLDGMIFDIDGTLVDTNPAHIEAWVRAFADLGYRVPADRIGREVGKGGDQLVPSVLGARAERRIGDRLRDAQRREYLAIAARREFGVFPGIPRLFEALAARGIRTALATSSNLEHLRGALRSAGIDLPAMADELVTKDDAGASKPAPDLVLAAARALGLTPAQCAMIGDTPFDAQACIQAGVVCLGVESGGFGEKELRSAGARAVWRDTGALLADLDRALAIAAPGPGRLDRETIERLMREALAVAREGLADGEVPIGAVVARRDGRVLARGYNQVRGTGDRTAHAEMLALARAADAISQDEVGLVLVSTLEPCVMCTGAAMESAVDTVLYGLQAPANGGTRRVSPARSPGAGLPRLLGGIVARESRALLEEWLRLNGNPEQRPFVEQLLVEVEGRGSGHRPSRYRASGHAVTLDP
ncbi:MAG TPA: HAD family hydrolase [Gemmatimonadales bacterium]|nr:HAD family hydrolase [Gemmatimonadales bacterium]